MKTKWWAVSVAVVVVAAVGLGVGVSQKNTEAATGRATSAATAGPEGVPIPVGPALAAPKTTGRPIDGIGCSTGEQVAFHIHAHLTVFVNGVAYEVPAAVGIASPQAQNTPQGPFVDAGSCFYWLHTHAADGIIHVESPVRATYTLGQFFDIWGEPLGARQVGPATGVVTAFYNGRRWSANPRDMPLSAHAQIQLDIGSPLVAPESIRFPSGL